MLPFDAHLARYQARAGQAVHTRLPAEAGLPARLHSAMHYACRGGKRLRAVLVYACGALGGAPLEVLDTPAAAVELLHAYSLIHDDLPAMDDDTERRGQPACHIRYDQGTAILAGDALQAQAFAILACDPNLTIPAEQRLQMAGALAQAAGSGGMCGGQQLDLDARHTAPDLEALTQLHQMKTGALLNAAAQLGGLAAWPAGDPRLAILARYASAFGLMYQIIDDLLDEHAAPDGEPNYAALAGRDVAKETAAKACAQAMAALDALPDTEPRAFLREFARFAHNRCA